MWTLVEKFWFGRSVIHPAPLPCFPLKSHRAVALLGAMRVNISISFERVLFVTDRVFVGLISAETWLRLGSHPMWAVSSFSSPAETGKTNRNDLKASQPTPFHSDACRVPVLKERRKNRCCWNKSFVTCIILRYVANKEVDSTDRERWEKGNWAGQREIDVCMKEFQWVNTFVCLSAAGF